MRRVARPLIASAATVLTARLTPASADGKPKSSTAVAAAHVEQLATSDGTKYTLDYLDHSKRFTVWRGNGERSSFSEMLASCTNHDVVYLGETHYDAVAHKIQEIVFARLAARRTVALSMEMFETDVQHVIDEYLVGLTREQDMLKDARPWSNYQHYRPMVELAREAGLRVIAANAPRRYVSAAGRLSDDEFATACWGPRALADLPPLPLPTPTPEYMAHLLADPEATWPEPQRCHLPAHALLRAACRLRELSWPVAGTEALETHDDGAPRWCHARCPTARALAR